MAGIEKSFASGATVILTSLKRRATVTEGPNRRGEYLVLCGSLSMWVAADLLQLTDPGKESKKTKEKVVRRTKASLAVEQVSAKTILRIDLHGKNRQEAVRLVEDAIDRALRSAGSRGESLSIEVIHGLGTGAVKKAVLDYLKASKVVASFREDVRNPGVTWVYL